MASAARTARIARKTHETDITLELNLDGGAYHHQTGVGFFDHMLDHVARHGGLGLSIQASGDTHIDDHHTVEDVGIALGSAIAQALGEKRGIERYGHSVVPMDEVQAQVAIDLSGRSFLVFQAPWTTHKIGSFDVQLVQEFFTAVAANARMNLHIQVPWSGNDHHVAEAIFKAFGRALRQAVVVTGEEIPSTKGVI